MKHIKYSQAGKITTITIDRPGKMNALNPEAMKELAQCWEVFQSDDAAWVAVLTSTGEKAFCVGMDLGAGESEKESMYDLTLAVSPKTHRVNKPVICAVKGYCLGLGWWLAMECDFRVASSDARMGIPENRLNICPIFSGLTARHVPPGIALELLLACNHLEAKRAYELGFLNRLADPHEVEREAVGLAEKICQNAPVSVRKTKELFYESVEMSRSQSLTMARLIYEDLEKMEDTVEGRQAFREKRSPQWKGK